MYVAIETAGVSQNFASPSGCAACTWNARLFSREEEQSELAIADDCWCHSSTVTEAYLLRPNDADLIAFTARLCTLRRVARPFANRWYSGLTDPLGLHDLAWITRTGESLQGNAWDDPDTRVLGCLIGEPGRAAAPLLLLVNADAADTRFLLPAGVWEVLLDSSHPRGLGSWQGQGEVERTVAAGSLQLLAAAGARVGW